uniref:Centrosomal protein 128 n=1 Tax=Oryzias sinensis TaxID=183150 RepID=A0A8C7ZDV8_9TELE
METSSESESFGRSRGLRSRGRRSGRDRERSSGSGTGSDVRAADTISQKISSLANTLQDTSRNLTKVDRMLGQYREHTDDQAEAMALLRENLEDSISQLQTKRLSRVNGVRTPSASTLQTSDLEIHAFHQSLRDLCSDHQRLSDDLDREILRRNRYLTGYDTILLFLLFLHSCRPVGRADLEKELLELRAQVQRASVLGEVEELKRALDCKEKERLQLSLQVKVQDEKRVHSCVLSTLQSRGLTEKREMEALLLESTKSRDDLKTRAQQAVGQWRAKCRRLQREVEERIRKNVLKNGTKQKESSHAQLKSLSQQSESACRELTEVLGRLAQRDEELHRREVELMEARQRLLTLEQENREEVHQQAAIQSRLKEENQTLEERVETQSRRSQRAQDVQAELQASLKQATAANAQLSLRLAEEESAVRELKRSNAELEAKLTALRVERVALGQQLQLEREIHQKELDSVKATTEDSVMKKEQISDQKKKQSTKFLYKIIKYFFKMYAASDKELREALQIKLDRMKDECDKLAAQLSTEEESRSLLQRKYQLLKQQLEDRRRASESERERLENRVLQVEADQEAVLTALGEELDAACRILAKNEDKLQVFTKLRWLCEEVREHDAKAQRWKKQHQQTKDQLKALRQSRDSEQAVLLQRLHQQEKLLEALGRHSEVSAHTTRRLKPQDELHITSKSKLSSAKYQKRKIEISLSLRDFSEAMS